MSVNLQQFRTELDEEWRDILSFWKTCMQDVGKGGFYGKLLPKNEVVQGAPKGVVLNARILWSFSHAYNFSADSQYLPPAARAFDYLCKNFVDEEFGGVYWSVDYSGKMLDSKKQVYGLGFCIYALSEYYKAAKSEKALALALALFTVLEEKTFDPKKNGYFEAFARDWKPADDMRLSHKDANEKKTTNTHLHIIEAYSNLFSVHPEKRIRDATENLLDLFWRRIINQTTHRQHLFFDENWNVKSTDISFGHDIESAWLLHECAKIIGSEKYLNLFEQNAVRMAKAALDGVDADGGMWHERSQDGNWLYEKHNWPQAEAMLGFFNAWEITEEESWLRRSFGSWEFIKKYIKDREYGEWHWGVEKNRRPMPHEDKAGFWKCPYHNSRACIEIVRRIDLRL
ncbi:MAG: N-acyl-D-glucosamine 2-epimerase [Candidatus Nephrothrix sp. EaCA]|nr:MAG: N-acyl-D-glucosamine 2-epimerase [Candidatus Nephrothrix sp. EaCA]